MNSLISVIIPVYNVKEYLDECLQSVVNQTYKNLEIIIIDDGSTDGSSDLCKLWSETDNRVKLITQKNKGVAEARNVGIASALGDYIYFVDSDDYISLNLCKKVVEDFVLNNADIVVFGCNLIDSTGKRILTTQKTERKLLNTEESLYQLLNHNTPNYFCNKIFKREVIANIKCPTGHVWEDLAVMYKIFLQANKVSFLPDIFYNYRQHSKSIVGSINEHSLRDIFLMRMSRYNDLKGKYPDIAELDYLNIVSSALSLYDVSLWKNVDEEVLSCAIDFLMRDKDKIVALKIKGTKLWYKNRNFYNLLRKTKHSIGNVLRKFRKK